MKKIISIIVAFLFLIVISPVARPAGVQYDGNKVYIDDDNVYLSATPHTLGSSGWVELELISKRYTGNIDIAFGFNITDCKPTKIQIWRNYVHPKLIVANEYYSYYQNGTLHNVTIPQWTWINESYYGWQDWNIPVTPVDYNYQTFNKWYISTNLPIVEDISYKCRVYVSIPFNGLNSSTGEYAFAVKPSSETLQQAISNGHFYMLDPWWNAAWGKRVLITTNPAYIDSILYRCPVGVKITSTYVADCQARGQDIRFVATDNTTLYDYEIETWNSTTGCVWVNITTLEPTTSFYLYYGNPAATDDQDSANVWDQYYSGVYHMNMTDVCWDSTGNRRASTVITGTPVVKTSVGKFGNFTFFNAAAYYNFGNVHDMTTTDSTIEIIGNATNPDQYPCWMKHCSAGAVTGYIMYEYSTASNGQRCQYQEGVHVFQPAINGNYWSGQAWSYFFSGRYSTGKIGELVGNLDNRGTATDAGMGSISVVDNFYICKNEFVGTGLLGNIDEVRVSIGIRRNSSWLNWTWYNLNKTDSLNWSKTENAPAAPFFPELVTLEIIEPEHNATDVCPCDAAICVYVAASNGSNLNITFYLRFDNPGDKGAAKWWKVEEMLNYTEDNTYCFCLCTVFNETAMNYHPMHFNTTYNWYVNSTVYNNETLGNETYIYNFTTAESPSDCLGTVGEINRTSHVIGLLGLFGLLGWIMFWRRRKREYD